MQLFSEQKLEAERELADNMATDSAAREIYLDHDRRVSVKLECPEVKRITGTGTKIQNPRW